MNNTWRPSSSFSAMKARAECYAQIRAFFMSRQVMEVDTPILGFSTATDPHLASLEISSNLRPGVDQGFLQTSPEFPMKRMLAAGSGDIFQLCKTFRKGEVGRRHNPEFTMLEWYRVGMTLPQLMDEVTELVCEVLGETLVCQKVSYRDAFEQSLGIDPFTEKTSSLARLSRKLCHYDGPELSRDDYLALLLADQVEPTLGQGCIGILHSYPASQASLAKVVEDSQGQLVAQRFELYLNGLEIANAYDELQDADEQQLRFEEDNAKRSSLGLREIPLDKNLLDALHHGMPECSGVALGVDRLLMIKLGASALDEVLAFPVSIA